MLSMLIAYDADGNVIATLDYMVAKGDDGEPIGLVDFSVQEDNDAPLTDVWQVERAVGSGTWPEWIGARAHDFKVEKAGKKITALVHKASGLKRDRNIIESAIQERIKNAGGAPADIRDIVGGPERPLLIDDEGKTMPKPRLVRPNLPVAPVGNLSGGGNNDNMGPSGAMPSEGTGAEARQGLDKA